MSWRMRVTRDQDTGSERLVDANYFDDSDPYTILHREQATFVSGIPDAEVRKELARRGRSMRLELGKARPSGPLQDEISPIDGT